MEQVYSTGSMPLLTPTTFLWQVVIPRHSPLPQFLRNAMENKLGRAGRLHPDDRLRVTLPDFKHWSLSFSGCCVLKCIAHVSANFRSTNIGFFTGVLILCVVYFIVYYHLK